MSNVRPSPSLKGVSYCKCVCTVGVINGGKSDEQCVQYRGNTCEGTY